jgi:hypothetical protein
MKEDGNSKEAMEYLVGLGEDRVKTFEINGQTYANQSLHIIEKVLDDTPVTRAIPLTSLAGLVDYIKNNVDGHANTMIVHICNPTTVKVYSELLRADKQRDNYLECEGYIPRISFGQFMDIESFNIMMQSCFVPNEDSQNILKIVSNIKEENVQNTGDDGVSQKVTAKMGISTVAEVKVPNPVMLFPFRTFVEVPQPESKFIFRLQNGPRAALFEADGGIWRIKAMLNIKKYLEENLQDCNVKIIS